LRWIRTVHHGYPKTQYEFSADPEGDYLAFLGRVSPEKGVDRAIEIAKRAGLPLRIAAKIDSADLDYFVAKIEPLLKTPGVEFIGEIGESEKSKFLGNARAVLFPISWPEPFGLVMIEAMACGTPVIGFNHGSVSEVISNDVTGFIVNSIDEAAQAAQRVKSLDRAEVRAWFEQRFSVDVMAQGYEAAYRTVLKTAEAEKPVPLPRSRSVESPTKVTTKVAVDNARGAATASLVAPRLDPHSRSTNTAGPQRDPLDWPSAPGALPAHIQAPIAEKAFQRGACLHFAKNIARLETQHVRRNMRSAPLVK
jgi:hypothetical protein